VNVAILIALLWLRRSGGLMPHASDQDTRDQQTLSAVRHELEDISTNTVRIEALSDAVFAVALTLLVLEIRLPETGDLTDAEFAGQLLGVAPKLIAYLLTFITVGQYWIMHRQIMDLIVRFDSRVMWINLTFLFFITLLPFSMASIGRGGWPPWAVYAMDFVLIGVAITVMWRYVYAHGMVDRKVTPNLSSFLTLRGLVFPSMFLLSIPVAFFNSSLASLVILLTVPLNVWVTRAHKPAG
jgi:uncharacterized membrane protein